jgi:hypothetical protein
VRHKLASELDVTLTGKLSLDLMNLASRHHEDVWGTGGITPPFSALDGGEWSASRPVRFTPGESSPGLGVV